jgi:hypothetical protein
LPEIIAQEFPHLAGEPAVSFEIGVVEAQLSAPPAETPGRGVLDGAFRLLRVLPEISGPGQLTALARITGILRPSVHRLLAQLSSVGAVDCSHCD